MGKDCDFCKNKNTAIPVYLHMQRSKLLWAGLKETDTICISCARKKVAEKVEAKDETL